jgi:hypothetical protein
MKTLSAVAGAVLATFSLAAQAVGTLADIAVLDRASGRSCRCTGTRAAPTSWASPVTNTRCWCATAGPRTCSPWSRWTA